MYVITSSWYYLCTCLLLFSVVCIKKSQYLTVCFLSIICIRNDNIYDENDVFDTYSGVIDVPSPSPPPFEDVTTLSVKYVILICHACTTIRQ